MDRRTQTPQEPPPRDQPADPGPGQAARPTPEAQKGAVLNIGPLLVQTIRHFWPLLNTWLDDIPDPRPQASVTYAGRFLLWWGLSLFLFKLGSRRQLDFELARSGPQVLDNLNRLAGTQQTTLPVNKTLDDFLGQLQQVKKLGPLEQVMQMIPGMGQAMRQQQVEVREDDLKHIEAIIRSMTPMERHRRVAHAATGVAS